MASVGLAQSKGGRRPLERARPPLALPSHAASGNQTHSRNANLSKLWPALWTFADVDDVEPTNNAAERRLRAAVIYRKLSLGSRSQGGERMIERLLSVDQTCRLQRRSPTPLPPKRAAIRSRR